MKIRLVGAELFRADRHTHRWTDGQREVTELTVAVCNFANVPLKRQSQSDSLYFFLFVTVCIQPVFRLSVYYGIFIVFFYKCDCTYVL